MSVSPYITKHKIGNNLVLIAGKIMNTVANKRITLTTDKGQFIGGSTSISSISNVSCDFGDKIFFFTPTVSTNTCPFIALVAL